MEELADVGFGSNIVSPESPLSQVHVVSTSPTPAVYVVPDSVIGPQVVLLTLVVGRNITRIITYEANPQDGGAWVIEGSFDNALDSVGSFVSPLVVNTFVVGVVDNATAEECDGAGDIEASS